MLIDSIETIGDLAFVGEAGSSSVGATITMTGGLGDGAFNGGDVIVTGGDGGTSSGGFGGSVIMVGGAAGSGSGDVGGGVMLTGGLGDGIGVGGDITITAGDGGTSSPGDGGDVSITAGSAGAASGGDGGDVIITAGLPDGGGTAGAITPMSPVVAAGTGITVLPGPSSLELVPVPKGALPGALGVGMAGMPPGSLAVVIDDLTGPTAFVLIIVDPAGTYVRTDSYAPIT